MTWILLLASCFEPPPCLPGESPSCQYDECAAAFFGGELCCGTPPWEEEACKEEECWYRADGRNFRDQDAYVAFCESAGPLR